MTPEEEARIVMLERKIEALEDLIAMWNARGLDQLQFQSLRQTYALSGHTH